MGARASTKHAPSNSSLTCAQPQPQPQALDVRQLEQAGRLAFQFPVVSYGDDSASSGHGATTWKDLTAWLDAGLPFHAAPAMTSNASASASASSPSSSSSSSARGPDTYVLFIDDLEALEALAPSAGAARRFMSAVLDHLVPAAAANVSSPAGGASCPRRLLTVVAYGRQDPHGARSRKQRQYGGGGGGARGGTTVMTFASGYGENIFFPRCLQGALPGGGHGDADGSVGLEPMLSEYLRYRCRVHLWRLPLSRASSAPVITPCQPILAPGRTPLCAYSPSPAATRARCTASSPSP